MILDRSPGGYFRRHCAGSPTTTASLLKEDRTYLRRDVLTTAARHSFLGSTAFRKRDCDEEATPRRIPTKEFRFENRGNPDGLKQFASGLS